MTGYSYRDMFSGPTAKWTRGSNKETLKKIGTRNSGVQE